MLKALIRRLEALRQEYVQRTGTFLTLEEFFEMVLETYEFVLCSEVIKW